jgi:MarR family transcriptional regulator for hemolysin
MNNAALTSEFLEALTKVSRRVRTVFNQQVTAHGLTYPRARALFRLAKKPNMTQTELACELELEQATLVRLLDRMEENGLISRQPDPRDRRAKLVALTPHGEEQATFVQRIADQVRERIFEDADTSELKQAIAVMDQISTNLLRLEDGHVFP